MKEFFILKSALFARVTKDASQERLLLGSF
jgi:hypothetical protein